MENNKN